MLDPLEDVLCLNEDRWQQVPNAMAAIGTEGRGAVIILRDSSPTAVTDRLKPPGTSPKEIRQYGVGAEILTNLGISQLIMLTNSPAPKLVGLDGYDIEIVETRPIPQRGA